MPDTNAVVAVYNTHSAAEDAIDELKKSGVDMTKVSIIGKDYHTEENVVGYYNAGDRMKYWGSMGAFWGGLWGLLVGAAFFWVPGIGPLLVAGPVAAWIVGALEGAVVVGGLSVLGAALYSAGIPRDSILKYETAIKADKYVVVIHGTSEEVSKARVLLATTKPAEVDEHPLQPAAQTS